MASKEKPIRVVVTGGNGFLGQHIVRLLQEKSSLNIQEIIVFDRVPFEQGLDYTPRYKCSSFVGDLRDVDSVKRCLCNHGNVDAVIHTASLISVGTFPDDERMKQINVQGTRNILEACISHNVPALVYTSSQEVVTGPEPFVDADESLPYAAGVTHGGYARTKCEAEKIVLSADRTNLTNGGQLRTTALRPPTLYGEMDKLFIPSSLDVARRSCGYMLQIGDGVQPFGYAGNIAWGHIKALEALWNSPDKAGGEVFFITDDTPNISLAHMTEKFLIPFGYKLTPFVVPYWVMFIIIFLFETVLYILSPIYKIQFPINTRMLNDFYVDHCFVSHKATARLGYKPVFTFEEALVNSINYYKSL